MFKRALWNISILIISACFFSLGTLEFVDRNLFFHQAKEERYLSETFILYTEIKTILQEQVNNVFDTTTTVIENTSPTSPHDSIENIIRKPNSLVSYLTIKDKQSNRVLFTNQKTDENISYPCIDSFYGIPEEKIFLICRSTGNNKIYLGLSAQKILKRIRKDLISTYPSHQLPVIKNIFLDSKNIYINLEPSDIILNKTLLQKSEEYLDSERNFKMFWQGAKIYTERISIPTIEKNKNYHLYYNPLVKERSLSARDIITISLLLFSGLIILIVGLKFRKNNLHKTTAFLDEQIHFQENIPTDNNVVKKDTIPKSPPAKRDLPELRALIGEVVEQEKNPRLSNKLEDLPIPDSSFYSADNSWKNLVQKFADIAYTLKCIQNGNTLQIQGVSKTSRDLEYQLPIQNFSIPKLMDSDKENFYVYKEAGKTTPIKMLLQHSFINPSTIEGALFVSISSTEPLEYIVHLFYDDIDHDLYQEIFSETLREINR